jgi:hypothetical protein
VSLYFIHHLILVFWMAIARRRRWRWWTNATLSHLAAGDYVQEGLGDLVND